MRSWASSRTSMHASRRDYMRAITVSICSSMIELGSVNLEDDGSGSRPQIVNAIFRSAECDRKQEFDQDKVYTPKEEKGLDYYEEIFLGLVNLRILDVDEYQHPIPRIPSSVYNLWNLQTLGLYVDINYIFEIWKTPLLRPTEGHLMVHSRVLKRIPNIKTLKLYYGDTSKEEDDCGLNKLCCLHKLESLRLRCSEQHTRVIREVSFPHSLKKMTLVNTKLPWEDIKLKIGSLPLLQVLKFERKSFTGSKWKHLKTNSPISSSCLLKAVI
ncbi:hypothetical protein SASPL_133488 [Salvia splendens]|uniref:Disease resistance protein RPM1 n=1 Tax=Salvia splendens TaxID=180675 RepID=A0A8X8X4D4_SALSN|nr:hypothetical protein SASPL_133488 [Salvia splendens]